MYEKLFEFEQALATFTGAPYVVVTDGCTSAIELCFRYLGVNECKFTPYTYLSIPMLMHRLGVKYSYLDHAWQRWVGEYPFLGTPVWDSARLLKQDMYRPGQMQCLSFGNTKPLQLGRVGAILLDDKPAYDQMSMMRSDGRDLRIRPWTAQQKFRAGYHYCPTLELCELGTKLLPAVDQEPKYFDYNDCRLLRIDDPYTPQ
jgi:dTDP-4-amino-4,6-dideoxygalactose transaminase